MKLVIEIWDYEKDGELHHFFMPKIEPSDQLEGISVHDKSSQTERFARLMDLSKVVEEAVNSFYENRTASSPRDSINTSGEP